MTDEDRCTACAEYCGEYIQCSFKASRCRNGVHSGFSRNYSSISWSEERRAMPSIMFQGLCMGHRFGSQEADANMLAAATIQDAANRIEYALKQGKLT